MKSSLNRALHFLRRYTALFLISVAVFGCKQLTPHDVNESGPTHVRIRNESGADMLNVIFEGNHFGDIRSGALSDYQICLFLSWEISVGFPGSTNRMQYVYVDFPGRRPTPGPSTLGKGRFTINLDLQENDDVQRQHLDLRVGRDE